MKLPGNSIGISDILAYRECPRRMSWRMRRHVGREQTDEGQPELQVSGAVRARSYGSAVHTMLQAVEEGWSDEDAVQRAWDAYGRFLDPEDLPLLREDLEVYRRRDFPNTRTVALEEDLRVPLLEHEGEMIFFRFKLDRLYERLDAPGTFVHVDYKSSKWARSEKEVHSDLQLWSYNWSTHELFPEIEDLIQIYDQLRYGQIPTRKTAPKRDEIKLWLQSQVRTILADEDVQEDGLLPYAYNEWCPWCPILESCGVVRELTDWSATRIAALAPERPKLKKDNTPSKVMEAVPLEPARIEEYVTDFQKAKRAAQVLDRFAEQVAQLLRELPEERRLLLGFDLRSRTNNTFTLEARRALHEQLGERFYGVISVTKSRLEAELGDEPELLDWALGLADRTRGTPSVIQRTAT